MKRHRPKSGLSRRTLVKGGLLTTAAFFGPWQHKRVLAQGAKPIKLGLTCDASGQYGNSGQDDLRGIRMAIDEFNAKGGVLGRKIEWITADTETNPATGTRVAERFIAQEQCGFLIGALHSGVANAITQVANKYGTIYFNTNSSAPSEAGENCSRVKFVWDGNGTNFSKAAVQNAVREDRQEVAAAHQRLCLGPHHIGGDQGAGRKGRRPDHRQSAGPAEHARLHLLSAEGAAGQARRGGDGGRRRRHQGAAPAGQRPEARGQGGLDQQPAGLARHLGRGRDAVRRVRHQLGITSCRCRASTSSSSAGRRPIRSRRFRCRATSPTTATWRRANCCAPSSGPARPTTCKVIKQLEGHKMSAADRMQHFDAYIDPVTHQVQQTIYLARRNTQAEGQDRPVRDHQLDQARSGHGRCRAGQVQAEGRSPRCRPTSM